MQLLQPCLRLPDNPLVDAHSLAPERPAFIKNRVRKEPPQPARVPVLDDELHVMPRVGLVGAGQLHPEMLPRFRPLLRRVAHPGPQVVDPEDAGLVPRKRPGLPVRGGGKLVFEKVRHGQHPQLLSRRESQQSLFGKGVAHASGDALVFRDQRRRFRRPVFPRRPRGWPPALDRPNLRASTRISPSICRTSIQPVASISGSDRDIPSRSRTSNSRFSRPTAKPPGAPGRFPAIASAYRAKAFRAPSKSAAVFSGVIRERRERRLDFAEESGGALAGLPRQVRPERHRLPHHGRPLLQEIRDAPRRLSIFGSAAPSRSAYRMTRSKMLPTAASQWPCGLVRHRARSRW